MKSEGLLKNSSFQLSVNSQQHREDLKQGDIVFAATVETFTIIAKVVVISNRLSLLLEQYIPRHGASKIILVAFPSIVGELIKIKPSFP